MSETIIAVLLPFHDYHTTRYIVYDCLTTSVVTLTTRQSVRVHGTDDDHCQLYRAGARGTFAGR